LDVQVNMRLMMKGSGSLSLTTPLCRPRGNSGCVV
jgi:hypothetical protein